MHICDHCKRVPIGKLAQKAKPFDYTIVGTKVEESNKSKKAIEREVVRIEMHLCDGCISAFNTKLGHFLHGIRMNEQVEFTNDTNLPTGVVERTETRPDRLPSAYSEAEKNFG